MIALMRDAIGIGLAATQIGIASGLLVFQVGPEAESTARQPGDRVALE